ncbi:SGNH/GDSL hydrolase family protein [Coraliomargarita parva]|uniref:SGNH/GDSL hydrolase family protein n=1 Tax=Coraliomargarita parva TaxID=3014050 RepID=UPI0022B446BE|nr:SGNH/GDSL hydrolase family protein [Coraliomargarita parva]
MKQVSLIGDSIRMGYQHAVRAELDGEADVWSPEGNCMHSVHHLFNLAWYLDQAADVIHFNCGLWDCRRLGKGSAENAVPVDLYVRNVDFLIRQIRLRTEATLIWATITPVVQSRYNARFTQVTDPCRDASDSAKYNEALAPVLAKHGVEVNDLYTFVMDNGVEEMICDDGVHYTDAASAILGRKVAEEVRKHF